MGKLKVLLLLCCVLSFAGAAKAEESVRLTSLEQAAEWIRENVSFPEEAYGYGYVGVERFVISADWEGRVYVTSNLSALNPALEQQIKDVVGRCPKCELSGMMIKDIYHMVEIDFAALVPDNDRMKFTDVSVYAAPRFVPSGSRADARRDSRDAFWEAVGSRLKLPAKDAAYPCTLSVRYTIAEGDAVQDIVVDGGDEKLCKAIGKAMSRTRGWRPAMTSSGREIPVDVCDRIVVNMNGSGGAALLRYKDPVLLNSANAPQDDVIVLTPDIPACLVGDYASVSKLLNDRLEVDRLTKFTGSFVVEKDGTISNLYTDTSNPQIDSALVAIVSGTQWTPAMQGGVPVRSIYRFMGTADEYEYVSGYISPNVYPNFLSDGRKNSIAYDDRRTKAYRNVVNEYPSFGADVYSYGKFRHFDHNDYIEALMVKGATPFRKVMVKKRKN